MVNVHQTTKPLDETTIDDHDENTLREMAGKAFFAGGYARWLYINTFHFTCHDNLDLFPSDKDLFGYAEALDASIFGSIYDLGFADHVVEPAQNSILLMNFMHPDDSMVIPLQFIRPIASPTLYSAGDPVKQLQRFNFHTSQFAVEIKDDEALFYHTDEGLADLKHGCLRINAINSPLGMMRRIVKDTGKGFTISLKEMLKLFKDWDARSDEYQDSVIDAVDKMSADAGAWDLDYRLFYEENQKNMEQHDLNDVIALNDPGHGDSANRPW